MGKHAEVGVIDSPRRVFEGYMYLSLKKMKRHQAHAFSLAGR